MKTKTLIRTASAICCYPHDQSNEMRRRPLKSRLLNCLPAVMLLASFAISVPLAALGEVQAKKPPTRYTVTDLGPTPFEFPGINNRGLVAGTVLLADRVTQNAFLWQKGMRTDLGTLGGPNSTAFSRPNERGQVAGKAETATPDGAVSAINERGQAVGASTDCGASPTISHAVLWSEDGSVTDLGNFGGTLNNGANDINNHGQVVGAAALPGNTGASHAFLWTARDGMRDLGAGPPGTDLFASAAFGINDNGQVVGWSCDQTPDCGGWIWQDGVMNDLTSLLPQGSPWNVIAGTSINSRGEIAAFGDIAGAFHALLLMACNEEHVLDKRCTVKITAESEAPQHPAAAHSEAIRQLLRKRLGVRFPAVNEQTR